ncbi:hypothetical protein ACR6C2_30000 [Streptomyces sp. INA 01156]
MVSPHPDDAVWSLGGGWPAGSPGASPSPSSPSSTARRSRVRGATVCRPVTYGPGVRGPTAHERPPRRQTARGPPGTRSTPKRRRHARPGRLALDRAARPPAP